MNTQIRPLSAFLPLATLLLIALLASTSHRETLASVAYVCLSVLICGYVARKADWVKLVRLSCLGFVLLPASGFAGTLTNTSIVVANPSAGVASSVTVSYTLGTALTNGNNLVYMQLPSGFVIPTLSSCSTAPFIVTLNGVTTSLGSTGLKSSICVTWNSNNIQINTGISIAAGTQVTVTVPAAYNTNPTAYGSKTMISMRTILSSGLTIDAADTLPSVYINPSDVGSEPVATASAVIPYVFKFTSNTTLNSTLPYQILTQGVTGMDFADAGSSTCSGSFSAGDSCTANFTFTPTAPGLRLGAVVLYDASGSPVSTGMVYGHGTGPQVLFNSSTVSAVGGGLTGSFGGVIDPLGNVYVPDSTLIKKIPAGCTSASCITTLGGGFGQVASVALDGAGVLYVVDYNANALKTLSTTCTSSSCVTTLGGGFSSPYGVVVDGSGTLYVSDADNNAVKKVPAGCTSSSCVITLADGFSRPYPLALDNSSNIYVGEFTGNTVKMIPSGCTSSSCVTVLGGGFTRPTGLVVDASGTVFVVDYGTASVKTMPSTCTTSSCVTTFGASFTNPIGVMLDNSGNLYVDGASSSVQMVTRTAATALAFASTNVGSTSSDSPQTVTIQNAGNTALQFPVPSSGKNPSVPANFAWNTASTCTQTSTRAITLAAGSSCTIAIDFKPTSAGNISGNVVLTDNNNNAASPAYTTQSIPVSGVGIQVLDHLAFTVAPPSTTTAGSAFNVTVTAYADSGTTVATNYSGPVVFTSSDAQAVFPTTLTLTSGVGTFSITLKTAGSQTLTVADAGGSPSVTSGSVTVSAASAASITSASGSGQSAIITNAFTSPLTVQVLDAYSNPVGSATVTFSVPSSGASATLSSTTCVTSSSATPVGGCGVTVTANDTTGSYSVLASVAGASTSATFSLTNASKTAQTITFVPASSQTFGTTPTLSATSTSGLTVSFTSATPSVCSVTSAGTLTFAAAGTCTINADQAGDSTYAAASRVQGSFTVNAIVPGAPQITAATSGEGQVTISFTPPTETGGTSITGYTVTSNPGGVTATGTASPITVSGLTNGETYTFTVTAKNSAGTGAPSAASVAVVVGHVQPVVTITSPSSALTYGAALGVTATATYNSTTVPGTFSYTVTSSSGTVSATATSVLSAGTYTLTANFTPTDIAAYKTATATRTVTVNQATPAIALVSGVNPVLVQNTTALTATVSSSVSTPTGSVAFLDGSTVLGTVALSNGAATLNVSSLAVGTHVITAVYAGDTNFVSVSSGSVSQLVTDFGLANSSSGTTSQTILPGGTATFAFAISPLGTSTFPAAVNLSVSGLPTGATYTITPASIAANAGSTNVTLKVSVPTQTAALHSTEKIAPVMLAFLLLPLSGRMRRRAGGFGRMVMMFLLLVGGGVMAAGLTGCGSSTGYFAQQQQSYNVVVTATSGSLQHSTTVTLTVQ